MASGDDKSYFRNPVRLGSGLQTVASRDATVVTLIDASGIAGSALFQIVQATLNSGAIPPNSMKQSSYTVSCAATDILLTIVPPTSGITSGNGPQINNTTGLGIAFAFVSAANTVAIGWNNPGAVGISHVTGTYTFVFIRN